MLHCWSQELYKGDGFPSDTAGQENLVKKYNSIPEDFYSRWGLPVVSPSNFWRFMHYHIQWMRHTGKIIRWTFQEQSSGSGRMSRHVSSGFPVGFPVDVRYGRDIHNRWHREMIDFADRVFKTAFKLTHLDSVLSYKEAVGADCTCDSSALEHQKRHIVLDWLSRQATNLHELDRGYALLGSANHGAWKDAPLASLSAIRKRCCACSILHRGHECENSYKHKKSLT